MTSIQLPYGRGHLCFNLPEERLAGIIESRLDTYVPQGTPEELVARSMEEPIGTPRLEELAKGKENVVLRCVEETALYLCLAETGVRTDSPGSYLVEIPLEELQDLLAQDIWQPDEEDNG